MGTNIKTHLEEALQVILKEDQRNTANNVKITLGLFEDLTKNKLQIENWGNLTQQQFQNLNQFESNGIIKVLGVFLLAIKPKKRSLEEITKLQPFLCSIASDQLMISLFQNLLNLSTLNTP